MCVRIRRRVSDQSLTRAGTTLLLPPRRRQPSALLLLLSIYVRWEQRGGLQSVAGHMFQRRFGRARPDRAERRHVWVWPIRARVPPA